MNQIRICTDVTNLEFEEENTDNKKILKTKVQFNNGEVFETSYVLALDKNIKTNYNDENTYNYDLIKTKEIDISKYTDGSFNGEMCIPKLGNGMSAIVLNTNGNYSRLSSLSSDNDWDNWYDYAKGKWANAVTSDESMFVWIPRFEYKITYYTDASKTVESEEKTMYARIEINFISKDKVTPTSGYKIHPAFRNGKNNNYENGEWNKEISGFWIAKYEMSMEKNGEPVSYFDDSIGNVKISNTIKAVSKPNRLMWSHINLGNAYYNSYQYNRILESHLMKNSEWGAVAYLAYSTYGVNEEKIKSLSSSITPELSQNIDSTTTGNNTGVYGLVGGLEEKTSTYVGSKDINSMIFGNEFSSEIKSGNSKLKSSKYVTLYNCTGSSQEENYKQLNLLKDTRYGDAILETSTIGVGAMAFNSESSEFPLNNKSFIRGGYTDTATSNGLFSYKSTDGNTSYKEGYRVVLITD